MTIKEHPEWTEKYPAIDGIVHDSENEIAALQKQFPHDDIPSQKPTKAIRSDIEKILSLNNEEFNTWFSERKITAQKLLKDYEIIGSIPALCYDSEDRKFNLDANCYIRSPIDVLKQGLDYLEKIKEVRGEYKG